MKELSRRLTNFTEIRGAVVASYQLMITIGILISNIINFGVREIQDNSASWRIVIGLGIFFSIPLGLGVLAVPESPRWLAAQGRWEDARTSMARLRGLKDDPSNNIIEDDLNEMREILEKERAVGTSGWLECFNPNTTVPKVVYRYVEHDFQHCPFDQQLTNAFIVLSSALEFTSSSNGRASTTSFTTAL